MATPKKGTRCVDHRDNEPSPVVVIVGLLIILAVVAVAVAYACKDFIHG